jgi:hypothetical protein
MSLRTRLFALVGAVVALTVLLVTSTVASSARRAFAAIDSQRTAVLVSQIRREVAAEGEQVAQRLERVATSDAVVRIAADIGRSKGDPASYVGEAAPLAAAQGLDFLDLVTDTGTILSSAHSPARFGYRHPWLTPGAAAMPESGRRISSASSSPTASRSVSSRRAASPRAIIGSCSSADAASTSASSRRWCCRPACACCCIATWSRRSHGAS